MLLKFEAIEEIGRFRTLRQKAPYLTKLSLIYARNGYGKSTLCSILRSSSDNMINIVKARRRLQAIKPSRVHLVCSNGNNINYEQDRWKGHPGEIFVFDRDYISKNIFVGESVTRSNKRSLLPIVMGCLLYTSPSPRDLSTSRMPSSA